MNPVAPIRWRRAALTLLTVSLSLCLSPAQAGAAEPSSQVRLLAARTLLATATLETIGGRGLDSSENGGATRRDQCTALAREALLSISEVTVDPASTDDVLQLSRAAKGLLSWIEEKLTTQAGGTPLLDERAAAVAKCVAVAKRFADGADEAYASRLQSWSVDALSLSIEKSETGGDRDWHDLAAEWSTRLGEVNYEPGRDDDLTRSVRVAAGRILRFPSWRVPVAADPAKVQADSALRVSLLKAALRADPGLDDLRTNLAAAAAAAAEQGGTASACMLWDLLQLALAIRTEKPELWKSTESQIWEQLLQLHFHRLTVAAHPIDQANTRPRRSDWGQSDATGESGAWFEFETGSPIEAEAISIVVLAVGDVQLTLPKGTDLGWTDLSWAVPNHPHWITLKDGNGAELGVVARWEGHAGPVQLPLPKTLPDGMMLLHGIETGAPGLAAGRSVIACSEAQWKRSRLAQVLLAAITDAKVRDPVLAEILNTSLRAVQKTPELKIDGIAKNKKEDLLPFGLDGVGVIHDALLAAGEALLLPPRALLESPSLGWTRARLGWEGDRISLVPREKPTVATREYVVRNVIEITVEESSR